MDNKVLSNYLIHLIKCAIDDRCPECKPENLIEEEFLSFCKFHKLENIVYLTMKKNDRLNFSEDIYKQFEKSYMISIGIQARQEYYLKLIEKAFESAGIDYLVLKGANISKLYPSSDMRTSADFDIYVGKDGAKKARQIMIDLGFEIDSYYENIIEHDEYTAGKVVHCELHKVLIQNKHPWQEECNKIVNNLKLCEGTKHCYKMSDEDFFVYNLAHTAKHMKFSGIGIRAFLDMWIIYKEFGEKLDFNYLEKKLKQSKLYEFEKNTKALCKHWFEDFVADDKIFEMAQYVIESGWVGTDEMTETSSVIEYSGNSNSKLYTKIKKYSEIIFISAEEISYRYPIVKKYKWLTPFCGIHRLIKGVFFRRDEIKDVGDSINSVDMQNVIKMKEFKNKIGL